MPLTNNSRYRRSRRPSVSKQAGSASVLSVLSATTNNSAGSHESNKTVTQVRLSKSEARPSKKDSSKKKVAKPSSSKSTTDKGSSTNVKAMAKEELNVFSFMEEEGDQSDHSGADEKEYCHEVPPDLSANFCTPNMRSPMWHDDSLMGDHLHSDSGISVRSSSPDRDSPVLRKYPTIHELSHHEDSEDEDCLEEHPTSGYLSKPYAVRSSISHTKDLQPLGEEESDSNPEAYYAPFTPSYLLEKTTQHSNAGTSESRSRNTSVSSTREEIIQRPKPKTRRSRAGYDLLASVLSPRADAVIKPIYRKFDSLNNRILMYLQDEISEMEENLRLLDDAIAQENERLGGRPVSRRAEAKAPSQLQWHRLQLLGKSFAKVEQYNRALTSYSNLTKSLEPASYADTAVYRDWIAERAPIVEQESAFLQTDKDLVAITCQPSKEPASVGNNHSRNLETSVVIVASVLVSTIIIFKIVPHLFARLIVGAVIGMASTCMLSPAVLLHPLRLGEWRKVMATYSAVTIILATIVS